VAATGQMARFVIFGSFVTAKREPNDVDVVLLMEDAFDLAAVTGEAALVFDHGDTGALRGECLLEASLWRYWRGAGDVRILAGPPRGRPTGHRGDCWGGNMIASDGQLQTTLERIAWFQNQVNHLRKTETNPANFRAAVSGFLAEIDRMQLEVREYLSILPSQDLGRAEESVPGTHK